MTLSSLSSANGLLGGGYGNSPENLIIATLLGRGGAPPGFGQPQGNPMMALLGSQFGGIPSGMPQQNPETLLVFALLSKYIQNMNQDDAPTDPVAVKPEQPDKPRPVTDNKKTTLDGNKLGLSQSSLDEIWDDPAQTHNVVQRELEAAVGSKDPAVILKKVCGVDIKTGFSEERKTIDAFNLYQDLLDKYTENVQKNWDIPKVRQAALGEKTTFGQGGVVLGQDVRDQLHAKDADQTAIIKKALSGIAGSDDTVQILNKILGQKIDTPANIQKPFADELYTTVLNDLLQRSKTY